MVKKTNEERDVSQLTDVELMMELRNVEHELQDMSHTILFDYSEMDVVLLRDMDNKIQLASLAYGYAWSMGINIPDILGTVKPWTCLLYSTLKEHKYQICENIPEHDFYKPVGGYWEATPGFHRWLMSEDFDSLYPLNAASLNMSPETIVHKDDIPADLKALLEPVSRYWGELPKKKVSDPTVEGWVDREDSQNIWMAFSEAKKDEIRELALKYNFSVSTNGVCFRNDKEGILPKIILSIFKTRREYQAIMKQGIKDSTKVEEELTRRGIKF